MERPPAPGPSDPPAPGPLPELSRSIELVRQFHAGDGAACNELLERYRPRLIRIVRVKLGALRRHLDEEDVVQEVLLIAATKLASFELRSHAGILHWLARIAENVIRRSCGRTGRTSHPRPCTSCPTSAATRPERGAPICANRAGSRPARAGAARPTARAPCPGSRSGSRAGAGRSR